MTDTGDRKYVELQQKINDLTAKVNGLRDLAHSVISRHDEEIRRQSREMHNQTSQMLTQLALLLHSLKDAAGDKADLVEEATALVQDLSREIRRICQDTGLSMLEHVGLADTLDWLFNRFRRETGIGLTYVPPEENALPLPVSLAALRIAEVFLAACPRPTTEKPVQLAATHGVKAGKFTMDLSGRGFRPADIAPVQLSMMAERARMAGGTLSVTSSARTGFRCRLSIPLAA